MTAADRKTVEALASSGKTEKRLHERARIVLLCAEGKNNQEIGEELGIHHTTVSQWRNRFNKSGVAGLQDKARSGRPRVVDENTEKAIVEATLVPPKARTHWSARYMAGQKGVSASTVRRIWKRHDLKPHIVRKFKLSNDPLFEEKVTDIVGLYLNPPEKAVVLSMDEKSQIQALDRSRPILPIRPGLPEHQSHDYKRHGTATLFAALNAATGRVIHAVRRRHRGKEFLAFLRQIDTEIPDVDIHIVMDNYATHKSEQVKAWLGRHPRFKFHFTPTGSSWINLVERLFGKLTDERVRRGVFKSLPALEQALHEWVDNYNLDPRPFKWTKKANEIIRKVAKYRRIYDTLH